MNTSLSKAELKDLIQDIVDDSFDDIKKKKQILDKEDVRKIVREMLKKQYKTFWQKSNMFLDNL